jgi:serine/threonine protein kinase
MKFTFPPESRPLDGYTLKRGIARGGFGEVYYGLSDAGKEVAIKLLQQNMEVELRGIQHCLNLRHPHLVAIHDVKTDHDSDHWVIMEYIAGDTLEQVLLKQRGPLPLEQIERWMRGVESGLAYLHDRGIVHRDVKPGNIFWDEGAIKIGDVGLSKFMTPSRRSAHTESVGTVYYMAPEVAYGKYGYEVDIYSCGIMLYEMLTGRLPFDGQSTGEILMKHLSEAPDLSIVPPPFRAALDGALRKDPKTRTSSITRLYQEFESGLRGRLLPPLENVAPLPTPTKFAEPLTWHKSIVPETPGIPVPAVALTPTVEPVRPNTPTPVRAVNWTEKNGEFAVGQRPFAETIAHRTEPQSAGNYLERVPLQDGVTFDWWLHRTAAAIGLIWLLFIMVHPASGMAAIMAIWPIAFACLRFEPVRGSGLKWLWQSYSEQTRMIPYSGAWWFRRLAFLGFTSLSILGLLCVPFNFDGASIPLTFLITLYLAYQLLRLSSRERLGISPHDAYAQRSAHWEFRDLPNWIVYRMHAWDQSWFGFWGQRIGFYFWIQIILWCVFAGLENRGGRGWAACAFFTVFLFPFITLAWSVIRPDMAPWPLTYLLRTRKNSDQVRPTTENRPVSDSRAAKVSATFTGSVSGTTASNSNSKKSKTHTAGLFLTPQSVREVPGRQRFADLTVSMSWAFVLTLLFAFGTGFLSPLFGVPSSLHPDPAKLGLFTITTLMAAWALLIAGKLTEGRSSQGKPRRILNLSLGLAVGAIAWWLGQILMVELSSVHLRHQVAFVSLGRQPLLIDNSPTFLSFLVFFGLLFGLRRWWWHIDAFRPAVFRISSVILTVAVAAALPLVFAFPWDWAVTWAAVISCVVQLSAVWIPPENRMISA